MADILTKFTTELIARMDGPLHFRFIFQPLIAAGLAFQDGLRDARQGIPPYGWTIFTNPEHRQQLLKDGWKRISKVFVVALVLDLIYQLIAIQSIKLRAAIIAACLLAIIPYILVRGPANRLMWRYRQWRQ